MLATGRGGGVGTAAGHSNVAAGDVAPGDHAVLGPRFQTTAALRRIGQGKCCRPNTFVPFQVHID